MIDQMFGELRYEDDYGWWGKQTLEFGGNRYTVDVLIQDDREKKYLRNGKEHMNVF